MYMDLRFYAVKTVISLDVIILVFFVLAYEVPNTLNSIKPRRHTDHCSQAYVNFH